MAIVVEDGSIVSGANSYVSRADAIAYAAARGVTLADSSATDVLLIKSASYLESFRDKFRGVLVTRDQPLAWPRYDAVIEGFGWTESEIPRQVINAQLAVVLELNAGEDPYNYSTQTGQVTEKTVSGAVTVRYAAGSAGSVKVSKDRESQTLIALLLNRSGLFMVRA